MPLRFRLLLALASLLLAPAAVWAAPLSPSAYAAQLATWQRSVQALQSPAQARPLAGRAPANWEVRSGAASVTVPAAWLGATLDQIANGRLPLLDGRRELAAHLAALAAAAAASAPPGSILAVRRRALRAILARREFASVHGPSMGDEIMGAIQRALNWLFGGLGAKGDTQAMAWGMVLLLLAVVVALLVVVLRQFVQGPRALRLEQPRPADSAWRDWLRRARELADSGDGLACAVCAYQAGLGFGEASGWWRRDATATPREVLRRLPPQHPARAPWRALIAQFESLRYAGADPDPAARRHLLRALEELGCR